jgi:hypothetical protein
MTNESEDMEYEIERQNELQAEKARQQRIRDKVPGRRTNGKARAGDIDGEHRCLILVAIELRSTPSRFLYIDYSVSCLGSSQR